MFFFKCFLFGEVYVEAGVRIGDLLSSDLVLQGDFLIGLFISQVGGGIAVFST